MRDAGDRRAQAGNADLHPGPWQAPSINLPKGGGAIRGIGEKFAANPVTGTGSWTVPIAISPGRSGFAPALSLSYDSGAGNGPFGLGWTLAVPAITRKTDKGLPRYQNASSSDEFVLSGAEDLVPVLVFEDGQWVPEELPHRTLHGRSYRIARYRPRIEGLFARIECWTDVASSADCFWRVTTRDNVTTWYGRTGESRIADPSNRERVFSWLICERHDDKGNVIVYGYKPEDSVGVDRTQAHEANRTQSSRSANRYLKRIRYGNSQPYFPDLRSGTFPPLPAHWLFEVVCDYGEHVPDAPLPDESGDWSVRHDPFSTYRAGFEVRTYRLCHRVLMFHHFADEPGVGANCLVRSTDLTYRYEQTPDDPRHPIHTELTSVTHCGYRRHAAGYLRHALPSLDFEYSQAVVGSELQPVGSASLEQLPSGVDGTIHQWLDLDGEGLPGVLTKLGDAWFFKRNDTPLTRTVETEETLRHRASLGPAHALSSIPGSGLSGEGRREFLDLAGDGQVDVVELQGPIGGYYERTREQGWHSFRAFPHNPNIDWQAANLRLIDLTGDGHDDLLVAEHDVLTWYPSLGEHGFGPAHHIPIAADEQRGPRPILAGGDHTLFQADMSGDGLNDLVRIRNGEICYWPNIGYGWFGAKVVMDAAPWFDSPEQFDPARVRLADIDGSGVADAVYLGRTETRIWFNQSGNAWSASHRLDACPPADDLTSVAVVDLLANGTACLVWSRPARGEGHAHVRYLELMAAGKPYLLVGVRNNLGAETRLRYAPSTYFYSQDKQAGRPWITRLPFPVHVVERVETIDHISRNRFVTRYAYHHGYFDGEEREFRGFGMVEQFDTEELAALNAGASAIGENIDISSHVPPVLTRTWFHTGAHIERAHVSNFFAGTLDEDDAGEYYREPGLTDEQARRLLLDDTVLPTGLTPDEEREACRSLKGSMLRQEVYARDATDAERHPFTVVEQTFNIQLIQPKGGNRHAVFFTHAGETINYYYERDPADPRINHALTLEVGAFGDVAKSVAVAYGRRLRDPVLGVADQDVQAATHVIYTEVDYTNPVIQVDAYRTPLPCETRTYELTGYVRSAETGRFTTSDFVRSGVDGRAVHIFDTDLSYEEVPGSGRQRRLIESVRVVYRPDDLGGGDRSRLLPPGELEPLALNGERYQLAFTPHHLQLLFGDRLTEPMLSEEGRYVRFQDDLAWWIPSGRVFLSPGAGDSGAQELAFARQHFFVSRRFRDPFGQAATIEYDSHDLLMVRTADALGNTVTAQNDYRALAPELLVDANGNRVAAAFDVLGMVAGTAVIEMGDSLDAFEDQLTQAQIDAFFDDPRGALATGLLRDATTRTIYDETRFARLGQPSFAATIARETHTGDLADGEHTAVQVSFAYSDGFGRIIQNKVQAAPGPVNDGDENVSRRWTTSGWTVFNNKGDPVKQFEPFFSADHAFEFAVTAGVSPTRFYDPVRRNVATLLPNHTWDKTVFGPWRQESWDVNDTVLTDPEADPDVGDFFRHLLSSDYLPTWHSLRTDAAHAADALARWPDDRRREDEADAARKAAAHAGTPAVVHFDSLGRSFLSVADNGPGGQFPTRTEFDIDGNPLRSVDARGNVVVAYQLAGDGNRVVTGYDMAGRPLYEDSMDGGERRVLPDIAGKPIRRWDSRGHVLRFAYDALQRQTHLFVLSQDESELLAERTVYGEAHADAESLNLRGRAYQVYDGAGVATSRRFDSKGNLQESSRQFAREYRSTVDWSVLADLTAAEAIEAAASPFIEAGTFTTLTRHDALNRVVSVTTPDESVTLPAYNEANLLDQIALRHRGTDQATSLIAGIDYDARGQRTRIEYATRDGTNFATTYTYDPQTLRLIRLHTVRARDNRDLQDLNYVFDPAGNITSIRDAAQQAVFFGNAQVEPHNDYTYDALYRLIEVQGREHAAQNNIQRDGTDFSAIIGIPFPNSPQALQRYREEYEYDSVGNILAMTHTGGAVERWTRRYRHADDNNRLLATSLPGDGANEFSASYSYDTHGNMTRMLHLPVMQWDFKDRLHAVSGQAVDDGMPETTYYVYDVNGQRVRKVTEHAAASGETPLRRRERVYLDAFESYGEYAADGSSVRLERQTLHVGDDRQRIAQIDTRTQGDDDGPAQSRRFIPSNHLRSSSLEVDDEAQVVSYEEYRPYGASAYIAARSAAEASVKRYRFTGKENDEETGLYYHGARYYAAWLGRWSAADPAGIADGVNRYAYVRGNPIAFTDSGGTSADPVLQDLREQEAELRLAYANAVAGGSDRTAEALRTDIEAITEQIAIETQLIAEAAETPMPGEVDETYNEDVNVTGYIPPQEERFSHPGIMDRIHSAKAERATRMQRALDGDAEAARRFARDVAVPVIPQMDDAAEAFAHAALAHEYGHYALANDLALEGAGNTLLAVGEALVLYFSRGSAYVSTSGTAPLKQGLAKVGIRHPRPIPEAQQKRYFEAVREPGGTPGKGGSAVHDMTGANPKGADHFRHGVPGKPYGPELNEMKTVLVSTTKVPQRVRQVLEQARRQSWKYSQEMQKATNGLVPIRTFTLKLMAQGVEFTR